MVLHGMTWYEKYATHCNFRGDDTVFTRFVTMIKQTIGYKPIFGQGHLLVIY